MRSFRLVAPSCLESVDASAPQPRDLKVGDVLLRVLAGGICGSDLPHFWGQAPLAPEGGVGAALFGGVEEPPLGFPMHEVVGQVLATCDPDIQVGQIVVGWASRVDALSEVVITRASGLHPMPQHWSPQAGVMAQPLACVIAAINQIGPVNGRRVAVIGLGPIGLLFAHVLRVRGVERVVGVDPLERNQVGHRFGVDEVHRCRSDRWVAGMDEPEKPDLIIEAVGHQTSTLHHAIQASAAGGKIYYFGVPDQAWYPLPMNLLLRKNLTLQAGAATDRRAALGEAITHLHEHPWLLDEYVTDVIDFADAPQAFERAASPSIGQVKVSVAY